jgi:hypothetical protein
MSRRIILLAGAAFAALLILVGTAAFFLGWWPRRTPLGLGMPGPQLTPRSDSFSARNWSYYLRPVPTDRPGPGPTAEVAWKDLFPGMAADPATRELLVRLYGGLPVEFEALDKQASDDDLTKPPGAGSAVALRVASLETHTRKTADGETLFGLIAIGRATYTKDAVSPPGKDINDALAEVAKGVADRPSDGEAFDLAVEDYMLRHGTGWLVVGGPIFKEGKLPGSEKEHRADLDARIKAFAEKSADYFDRLRGKK